MLSLSILPEDSLSFQFHHFRICCPTGGRLYHFLMWLSRQTGRQSNHHKWLACLKISSVEELETLPAGRKPRTPYHRSLREEKHRTTKCSMISLKRKNKRVIISQMNAGTVLMGKTSERRGGAPTGLAEYMDAILIWTELHWCGHDMACSFRNCCLPGIPYTTFWTGQEKTVCSWSWRTCCPTEGRAYHFLMRPGDSLLLENMLSSRK